MASLPSKFQIPGLILSIKNPGPPSALLTSSSKATTTTSSSLLEMQSKRCLWLGRSKKLREAKRPIEEGVIENCGNPSRCFEKPAEECKRLFARKKFKQRAECAKPRKFWEYILGVVKCPKKASSFTCRSAHQRRRKRCQAAAQVECSSYGSKPSRFFPSSLRKEPRPRPPPSFKMPKAVVLFGMTRKPNERMDAFKDIAGEARSEEESREVGPKPHRIPYEEMRPPKKRRRDFNCREGILANNGAAVAPFNKESKAFLAVLEKTVLASVLDRGCVDKSTKRRSIPSVVSAPQKSEENQRKLSRFQRLELQIKENGIKNIQL